MGNTLIIPKLSILIPSIPSRLHMMSRLFEKISSQIGDRQVEILSLLDNKRRSIGLKRDALVQSSNGRYLTFVDDDDDVATDYVDSILPALDSGSDVVVFKQQVTLNGGNPFIVDFDIHHPNDATYFYVKNKVKVYQDIRRRPFHSCVWKGDLARKVRFPDASFGEDWHWCERLLESVRTQTKIDKVLHFYNFSQAVTEAAHDYPS